MKLWLPFLLLNSTLLCAQSQTNSPLNEAEKRQILGQLIELSSCRKSVVAYEEYIKRESELYQRETDNWNKALSLEKQATALMMKERDLAAERAKFYEESYHLVVRKPGGVGCWFKKLFSLGLARCR